MIEAMQYHYYYDAAQQSSIFYYSLMRVKCDVDSLY